ncbi:MAG: hypothetical protein ACOC2U_00770 [bacterium]
MNKEHEKINYRDIMNLGFTEQIEDDRVYFDQYGFDYAIINLNLTENIYLDWEKETKLCWIVRIDGNEECNIIKKRPVKNLKQLKEIVDFFLGEKDEERYEEEDEIPTHCAVMAC